MQGLTRDPDIIKNDYKEVISAGLKSSTLVTIAQCLLVDEWNNWRSASPTISFEKLSELVKDDKPARVRQLLEGVNVVKGNGNDLHLLKIDILAFALVESFFKAHKESTVAEVIKAAGQSFNKPNRLLNSLLFVRLINDWEKMSEVVAYFTRGNRSHLESWFFLESVPEVIPYLNAAPKEIVTLLKADKQQRGNVFTELKFYATNRPADAKLVIDEIIGDPNGEPVWLHFLIEGLLENEQELDWVKKTVDSWLEGRDEKLIRAALCSLPRLADVTQEDLSTLASQYSILTLPTAIRTASVTALVGLYHRNPKFVLDCLHGLALDVDVEVRTRVVKSIEYSEEMPLDTKLDIVFDYVSEDTKYKGLIQCIGDILSDSVRHSADQSVKVWQFFKLWFQRHPFDNESTGFYGGLFSGLTTTYRASRKTAASILSNWLIDDDYAIRRRVLPLLHTLLHADSRSLHSDIVSTIKTEFTTMYKGLDASKRLQLINTLSSLRFVNVVETLPNILILMRIILLHENSSDLRNQLEQELFDVALDYPRDSRQQLKKWTRNKKLKDVAEKVLTYLDQRISPLVEKPVPEELRPTPEFISIYMRYEREQTSRMTDEAQSKSILMQVTKKTYSNRGKNFGHLSPSDEPTIVPFGVFETSMQMPRSYFLNPDYFNSQCEKLLNKRIDN